MVLATNYTTQKSYLIFNYDNTVVSSLTGQSVLIGYKFGANSYTSPFSSALQPEISAYDIFNSTGNTSKYYIYIYRIFNDFYTLKNKSYLN